MLIPDMFVQIPFLRISFQAAFEFAFEGLGQFMFPEMDLLGMPFGKSALTYVAFKGPGIS